MICEECKNSAMEAWAHERVAVRCFSPELHGRVMNSYPANIRLRTEAPRLCPLRKEKT